MDMLTGLEKVPGFISVATRGKSRPIVFVCGLAGSGKTSLCRQLAEIPEFSGHLFSTDWYLIRSTANRRAHIEQARQSGDRQVLELAENPYNWYDWEKIMCDLTTLQTNGCLDISHAWNQQTGEKDLDLHLELGPNDHLFCDGIYLLHSPIVDHADAIILLETSPDLARSRTDSRDRHRNDREYLAYKDYLTHAYDIPYFSTWKHRAQLIVRVA